LKIAYFINQYPKVSHTFIRREILALERQGFDVQRIALRGWTEVLPDPEDQNEQKRTQFILQQGLLGLLLPVLRMLVMSPLRFIRTLWTAIRLSRQTDRRIFRHIICVAEACRLAHWLRQCGAARLHAHFGTNSAEVAMWGRSLGGPPYSFTVHGPEEFESPMGLAEKVQRAEFVSAISSYCRSQLYLRCKSAQWPKIHVVRCGVDASFQQSTSTEVPQSPRLVCVGRLCEAKGQLLLVEAAARLRARNIEFDVVLAGDGPLRTEIETAIKRHGLEDTVRITGWISNSDVREAILAARALILPSFAEGLPVVIMEAMALRRPVASTFVAGIPELVRPGESGWLFPAGSLDELVATMQDVLSTPAADIKRMGEAGYLKVLELHSIDKEAAKLAQLFRQPTPNV
jgi:colanic acid/amylovoran biosynthesis glycosyltransferase